ncbi:MAG: hypothetical protein J6T79_04665 [Verrucomicrobia bacterium]|nr:hypothetical protein [Verrucomicrobiota bacterium]
MKKNTIKTILTIIGVCIMGLFIPTILGLLVWLCVGFYTGNIGLPPSHEEMVQMDLQVDKEIRSQSGIIFPEDTLCIYVSEDRDGRFLYYTAKTPFQFPENLHIMTKKREKQNGHLIIKDDFIHRYEKSFSESFKTHISSATDFCKASWETNTFSFTAKILNTDEKSYLKLFARKMEPSELEAIETRKEKAAQE